MGQVPDFVVIQKGSTFGDQATRHRYPLCLKMDLEHLTSEWWAVLVARAHFIAFVNSQMAIAYYLQMYVYFELGGLVQYSTTGEARPDQRQVEPLTSVR